FSPSFLFLPPHTDYCSPALAQSVEHETLNLRVVGSSPTLGEIPFSQTWELLSVLWSLVVDLGLLALFTTQHSLLAWSPVKQALQSVLGALNRTAYCFTTALTLQILMRY
uniref:Nurim n=1 Tax=Labrus bergylta TaxID=56723 RepID=A0A3Q3NEL4_9LABR